MYNAAHDTARRYGFEEQIAGQREYDRMLLDKKRAILMVWDRVK
jgi:hypothetical protein